MNKQLNRPAIRTFLLACALCCATLVQAQDKAREAAASAISQEVMIVMQADNVRFTSQRAIQMMQLQIFNQSGEQVYDSTPMTIAELNWPLRHRDGEAVKSGLYAYVLTIQESGAAEPRVRRGHFIVDRAQDRDGKTDQLWVTSHHDTGVGTELTVARSGDATIAGTSLTSERTPRSTRDTIQREVTDKNTTTGTTKPPQAMTEAVSGTVGQIAKFTSATDLSNSILTEASGRIGIGTTAPAGTLHVRGNNPVRILGDTTTLAGSEYVDFFARSSIYNSDLGGFRIQRQAATGNIDTLFFAAAAGSGAAEKMRVSGNGNVGIGTANPLAKLEVVGNWDGGRTALRLSGQKPTIEFAGDAASGNVKWYLHLGSNGPGQLAFFDARHPHPLMALNPIGLPPEIPRMQLLAQNGLDTIGYQPFLTLTDDNAGYARVRIQNVGGDLNFQTHNASVNPAGGSSLYVKNDSGNVGIGTATPQARLDVVGQTRTETLQIVGGADFAENFDINPAPGETKLSKPEPGFVVAIDPTHPGQLSLSTKAYDRRVAGIISGAGGVKPGMMMSQSGTLADGQHPVALSGRVYCWADASQGAIEPGDLLTTSATPGHAMKVTDAQQAQGAIIGKAMTGLKQGKGLVLVLVTLQ